MVLKGSIIKSQHDPVLCRTHTGRKNLRKMRNCVKGQQKWKNHILQGKGVNKVGLRKDEKFGYGLTKLKRTQILT